MLRNATTPTWNADTLFLKKLPPVRKASEIVVNDSLKPAGLEALSMRTRPMVEEKVGLKMYDLTRVLIWVSCTGQSTSE